MTHRHVKDSPTGDKNAIDQSAATIWVTHFPSDTDIAGRLGDARELADRCSLAVGVLSFDSAGTVSDSWAESWIEHGADEVHVLQISTSQSATDQSTADRSAPDQSAIVAVALDFWRSRPPRLVLSSADRIGRAWSARLSARAGWTLVSPTLLVQAKGSRFVATRLDSSDGQAQQITLPIEQPAIVAMRPGVAQPLPRDPSRQGQVHRHAIVAEAAGRIGSCERVPPDPHRADIRHLPKLIAGGKGVGSREGFEILRRIAAKLGAGVAASRMAVDLGWIEAERQVGQTGKTVRPELYLACGISGAGHHLEGMSESRHVVAINNDANAPLMQRAELALQVDLHQVLSELDRLLESTV